MIFKSKDVSMPTFKLDFHETSAKDPPFDPHAYVALDEWTEDENRRIHLTPQCNSPEELEFWIRALEKELEVIRNEAQNRFKKSRYYFKNRSGKKQSMNN